MWPPLTRDCENTGHVNRLALWGNEKVKAVITLLIIITPTTFSLFFLRKAVFFLTVFVSLTV